MCKVDAPVSLMSDVSSEDKVYESPLLLLLLIDITDTGIWVLDAVDEKVDTTGYKFAFAVALDVPINVVDEPWLFSFGALAMGNLESSGKIHFCKSSVDMDSCLSDTSTQTGGSLIRLTGSNSSGVAQPSLNVSSSILAAAESVRGGTWVVPASILLKPKA